MGSLTSKPKSPAATAQQVVYVPAPAATQAVTQNTQTQTISDAEQRKENLLLRDRGRFGTIFTGFRGLLSPLEQSGKRKTLLGE